MVSAIFGSLCSTPAMRKISSTSGIYAKFARGVIPIHVEWLDRCVPLMRQYIEKNFRPIPGNSFGTMFHATVEFSRSIAREQAQETVKTYFQGLPAHSVSFQLWYQHIWEQGDYRGMFRPTRVRVTSETADINENISAQSLSVSFPTPTPEFLKKDSWHQRATWTNVIQPRGALLDDVELATVYPSNIFDPKFPRLRLGDWAAVSREGWVFPETRGGSESPASAWPHSVCRLVRPARHCGNPF
jgi:hypothetical protein